MWKLTGALLLTACGGWWGLNRANVLARRVAALEAWEAALELLEGELTFSLPDLPALFSTLSTQAPPPAGQVFAAALRGLDALGEKPLAQIWQESLRAGPTPLAGEDLEALDRLGLILGRYGWEEQQTALRSLSHHLEERRREAAAKAAAGGRIYTTLGLALGAFCAILLL